MNKDKDLNKNIIFFDVETNGFQGSSVLSMSAIKVNYNFGKSEWLKVSEFNRFYFREEDEEMNEGAINVNGLTDEVIALERKKLKDKIGDYPLTFKKDMDNFFLFCQDTDHFVAHNINFDRSFVDFSLKNQFDTMMENIDIVLSREILLKKVWGYKNEVETNVIDVYVRYIRNKIDVPGKESYIQTVRGTGYVMRS